MLRGKKAATALGVSMSTLRRWDAEGRIKTERTPGGQRMFDIQSIMQQRSGMSEEPKRVGKCILYARVSSSKQANDLQRQKEYLRTYLSDQHSTSVEEVSDIGSGINFKRRGLLRILESVLKGDVSEIVVASRDRLCRFGYELVEWMCKQSGTNIVVLNSHDTTPEQELGEDLMAIVQVYCCRWNGKRRYRATKAGKEAIQMLQAALTSDSGAEANDGEVVPCSSQDIQCDGQCPE